MLLFACFSGLSFDVRAAEIDTSALEKLFHKTLKNHSSSIDVSKMNIPYTKKNQEAIFAIYLKLLRTNPEYFHVENKLQAPKNGKNFGKIRPLYTTTASQYKRMLKELETKTKQALAAVPKGVSDAEKVLAIHDYLAYNAEFVPPPSGKQPPAPYNGTAYGALVLGTALCDGYTKAFLHLMKRLGIECKYVYSDKMVHSWNMVRLAGYWYHVDVTWDDRNPDRLGQVHHNFLLISDRLISDKTHKHRNWRAAEGAAPAANSTKYNNFFWRKTSSAIWHHNGQWLYADTPNKSSAAILRAYSFKTGQSANRGTLTGSGPWKTGNISYDKQSALGLYGNRLYYNVPRGIRYVDLSDFSNHEYYNHKGLTSAFFLNEMRVEGGSAKFRVRMTPVSGSVLQERRIGLLRCHGSYNTVTVRPTCKAGGYTIFACVRCTYSYKGAETSKLAHKWTAWKTTKKATVKATGKAGQYCTLCSKKQEKTLPKLTAKPTAKHVPVSATVKSGKTITLKAPANTTLYYTVNSKKNPTTKTTTKVNPGKTKSIKITKKTTVRVIAVKKGCSKSGVVVRNYKIK